MQPVAGAPYPEPGFNKNAQTAKQQKLKVKTSSQAAQLVKKQRGGKVLKVQKTKRNGRVGYKVKVIKANGHIKSVVVDAKSGKIKEN